MNKLIIPLMLILVGCASVGHQFDSTKIQSITKGETTESQLVAMFGPPMTKGINSEGEEVLTWMYTEAQVKGQTFVPFAGAFIGGMNSKTKTLTVSLAGGKVTKYQYSGGGFESTGTTQKDPEQKPAPH